MTDTLTPVEPWPILAAVLETVPADRSFSSASWHDEAVLAGLRSGQIVAAQRHAVKLGWLTPIGQEVDGKWCPNMVRAVHEKADGRWVMLFRRTSVGQPARREIDGQVDLFELVGGA